MKYAKHCTQWNFVIIIDKFFLCIFWFHLKFKQEGIEDPTYCGNDIVRCAVIQKFGFLSLMFEYYAIEIERKKI